MKAEKLPLKGYMPKEERLHVCTENPMREIIGNTRDNINCRTYAVNPFTTLSSSPRVDGISVMFTTIPWAHGTDQTADAVLDMVGNQVEAALAILSEMANYSVVRNDENYKKLLSSLKELSKSLIGGRKEHKNALIQKLKDLIGGRKEHKNALIQKLKDLINEDGFGNPLDVNMWEFEDILGSLNAERPPAYPVDPSLPNSIRSQLELAVIALEYDPKKDGEFTDFYMKALETRRATNRKNRRS